MIDLAKLDERVVFNDIFGYKNDVFDKVGGEEDSVYSSRISMTSPPCQRKHGLRSARQSNLYCKQMIRVC